MSAQIQLEKETPTLKVYPVLVPGDVEIKDGKCTMCQSMQRCAFFERGPLCEDCTGFLIYSVIKNYSFNDTEKISRVIISKDLSIKVL
jgi:hypothetical protein